MYYGSNEFNSIVDTPNGQALKNHLIFSGKTINNIKSIRYYGGSNISDDIAIGTAVSAYVEVSLYDDSDFSNSEFQLMQSVQLANGSREYMPIGFFTPRRPDVDDEQITFTAYDRMHLFNVPYHSQLTYPATSDAVIDEICEICGVELGTPITEPITIPGHIMGYTCREMLGYVAGLHGYFACIDRYGKLNLRWYSSTPIEKQLKLVYSFEKSQSNYTVELLKMIKNSETSYLVGTGSVILNYSNPYATQAFAESVHSKINGFTFRPGEMVMLDDARVDPWDVIKVVDLEDKEYLIPCMQIEHNFDDGTTRIQSVGATETERNHPFEGPMIQYLNRMATELLTVNKLVANSVTVQYLEANYVATNQLDAVKAEIEEAVIGSVSADFADIRFANIDVANIDKTNIGLLFAEVGLLTSATIVEGHVTGFLNSVEINANSVTAGTLSVDRLVFRGSEKSIVYELNNITGALQAVQGDTLNGEILTSRSITVDKIVAKSITANEIASKTITANEIMANSITGNEIAANSITADKLNVKELSALNATIGGIDIGSQGLYYSGSSATDGFGFFRSNTHADAGSYIILHAGANYLNISSAPFKVYQNGNVVANNIKASNADITGKVTATSGSFTGEIKASKIEGSTLTSLKGDTDGFEGPEKIEIADGKIKFGIYIANSQGYATYSMYLEEDDTGYAGQLVVPPFAKVNSNGTITGKGTLELKTVGNASNLILHNNYDRKAYIRIDESQLLWFIPHTSSGFDTANSASLELTTGKFYANDFISRVTGANLNSLAQNTDGKFILPNGLKICWGWTSTTYLSGYFRRGVVTFPVTYTNPPIVVTTDWIYNQDDIDVRVTTSIRQYSTTGCHVWAKDPGGGLANRNVDINWIAIGY